MVPHLRRERVDDRPVDKPALVQHIPFFHLLREVAAHAAQKEALAL